MSASDILDEARSWLGTPYKWRAKLKGVGADCGTFLHAVFEKFYDIPPLPEAYREALVTEEGYDYWLNYLRPVAEFITTAPPGSGVLFKYGRSFSHGGIVDETGHIIHCYGRKGFAGVTRSPIGFFREHGRMRETLYWRFPDELLRV